MCLAAYSHKTTIFENLQSRRDYRTQVCAITRENSIRGGICPIWRIDRTTGAEARRIGSSSLAAATAQLPTEAAPTRRSLQGASCKPRRFLRRGWSFELEYWVGSGPRSSTLVNGCLSSEIAKNAVDLSYQPINSKKPRFIRVRLPRQFLMGNRRGGHR